MRRIIVPAVCLTLLAGGIACAEPQSKVQWDVSDGGNGHWYEAVYVPTSIAWTAANAAAASSGGYLATATSESESEFIYSLISDDKFWCLIGNNNGPWIGGYQDRNAPDYSEPGGGWRWVTDEPFAYTNWDPRQPDNGMGGTEDYMHFFGWWGEGYPKTPKWNDARSIEPFLGYVVEYNAVPEPSTILALVCGLGGLVWRRGRSRGN